MIQYVLDHLEVTLKIAAVLVSVVVDYADKIILYKERTVYLLAVAFWGAAHLRCPFAGNLLHTHGEKSVSV
jgi:hypothetical protein